MKKVVFLSMDSLQGFECYDHLVIKPLHALGWQVEEISWRKKNVNWNNFDAVIVRSTWDYQSDAEKFTAVLDKINNSTAHLENDISILKWNMNKSYLADLQKKGIRIVDTLWENNFDENRAPEYFRLLNCNEIIIKPNISANADNTIRWKSGNRTDGYVKNNGKLLVKLKAVFEKKEFMVQPFMKSIVDEGEYSLFFFGCEYSHAVLKKPKRNDFRVQEEHGGILQSVVPFKELVEISENILSKLEKKPLYARIDLIRTPSNEFALMELELIEPSLYFNMDSKSAKRFASAFDNRMKQIN